MDRSYSSLSDYRASNPSSTDSDVRLLPLLEAATEEAEGPAAFNRIFQPYTATRYARPLKHAEALYLKDFLSVTQLATGWGNGTFPTVWSSSDYLTLPFEAPELHHPYTNIEPTRGRGIWPVHVHGTPTVRIAALWGFWRELRPTGATLINAIDSSQTTATVTGGGLISPGMTLPIGSEDVYVAATNTSSPATLTIVRGVNGTTPAAHGSGLALSRYAYPASATRAVIARAKVELGGGFESVAAGIASERVGDVAVAYRAPSSAGASAAFDWSPWANGALRRASGFS